MADEYIQPHPVIDNPRTQEREQMSIAVVGHVDHGKSTVIGRLLADTGSLPEGKLEQVRRMCELNARPFEYAFLLDALQDEQAQGITIDSARCFFKTGKRNYIIIDAPGHIEFLKNMVTGTSRAEAALLVIDAHEGIQENSRRHGYMVSFLGIRHIAVLVNKMDLVDHSRDVFENIRTSFEEFLLRINVNPAVFIPVSAREGDHIAVRKGNMQWYQGPTVLEQLDLFTKEAAPENKPFRFPVQDIYRFTEQGDDRRIVAGTVETGSIGVNENVVFLPSGKRSSIRTVEAFASPEKSSASAGQATGFTLTEQVYIRPGEIMCRQGEDLPHVGNLFRANIFWMGRNPMVMNRKYKLKIATNRANVFLRDIRNVLDASELSTDTNKQQIDRYDVADCVLETLKPVPYDLYDKVVGMGRFVIIDAYDIAGGGIITETALDDETRLHKHVRQREYSWTRSAITGVLRSARFNHKPKFIVITGSQLPFQQEVAKRIEEYLFNKGKNVYYLGISNISHSFDLDEPLQLEDREERINRLGELAYMFQDAGMILITTIHELEDYEIDILRTLNAPNELLIVHVGSEKLNTFPAALNIAVDDGLDAVLEKVKRMLHEREVLLEYYL